MQPRMGADLRYSNQLGESINRFKYLEGAHYNHYNDD